MAHCLPRPFTHSNLPVCGDTKVPTAVRKSARRIRFHRFNSISNLLRTIQGQNRKEEKIYIYIREREREREKEMTRGIALTMRLPTDFSLRFGFTDSIFATIINQRERIQTSGTAWNLLYVMLR